MAEKGRFTDLVRNRFRRKKPKVPANAEELRIDFKQRYHNFKLLLNANNKALEIMAKIERTLGGKQPFGMSFVKTSCLSVTVDILRLLKHLEQLSGGKYNALYSRFDDICSKIRQLIEEKKEVFDHRLVIFLSDIDRTMADVVGSKMASLGEIAHRPGLRVPAGFVITAGAYRFFLDDNDLRDEIDKRCIECDLKDMESFFALSTEIRELIMAAEVPERLAREIRRSYEALQAKMGKPVPLALRSSAIGEDSAEHSFAGQYRSELNIRPENLLDAYKSIIAGKYSLNAITYRQSRGIRDEDIAMSVGCVAMVDARSGGVMYSRNPLDTADDSVFINSAWGLPKAVVDGSINGDLVIISKAPELHLACMEIQEKPYRFICRSRDGVCRLEATGRSKDDPSISVDQALALADLALGLEQYYGSPQDIEWAIDKEGAIYILQCRPLRQAAVFKIDFPGKPAESKENVIAAGGEVIFPGVAAGKVFMVDSPRDMMNFPEGAVMVVRQALPLWAPLLDRAAAVVSEQGTFAGHLANVARELNVPAVFGVKGITRQLGDGDRITVDAGRATIYRGEIDLPRPAHRPPVSRMEGSPVYNVLREVSRFIVPLNLLDPNSPDFKPENCTTLHDITRYSHEKAVQEMFNFGREHDFSERSSKQLYYKVPMQWWILNLDDGFTEEIRGKYVHLEQIASIPMLALWEGIMAVPWEGPPPIDRKGLASVMFQSTADRGLEPGVRSAYTERNYFLISKNFCSFTSRLGYHFSIVEALVSERNIENYISFHFKGGAADHGRRIKRVQFIAGILSEYGFRAEIRDDMLISRLEGFDKSHMLERLRIIGYLVMHTRQLDMVMFNPAAITYYRSKIDMDIKTRLIGGN